jgi:CubicO group peptidase (beta-lactamase class C family)
MTRKIFAARVLLAPAFAVVLVLGPALLRAAQSNAVPEIKVDALFAKWTAATPGCAVGVAAGGKIVLERAYGMADLEHDAPNRPDTIFEAGSVAKQFTAAAVLLLARDGKLSLDDPARKYLPELPDYGTPLTIRHMLQHTSGLRDWGGVEEIAGWPRTSRVYSQVHVVDIASRQQRLNFTPGTRWSYSNTGYNLAAIIVARVSGEPFSEFTRKRIFQPLGMSRTSWRDDFRRVVKGRAIAYGETAGTIHANMPFENAHGNGGLLTTVGDLLRWNENFVEPRVGDAATLRDQQAPGRLNDGREHGYGFGLFIGRYKGLPEVSHGGSTAGYRAFLARYPEQQVSVAVLCNTSSANPEQYVHAVADLYLGESLKPPPEPQAVAVAAAELDARAGLYRHLDTGLTLSLVRDKDTLRTENKVALVPLSATRFALDRGAAIEFDGRGGARFIPLQGLPDAFEKVPAAHPTPDQLAEFIGRYSSDEAEVTLQVVVRDGVLALVRRPDTVLPLTPLYADAFRAPGPLGMVRFHRDSRRRVREMSVVNDRVWDLRLRRE